MRIIAVANQKGGCGKTTTAINLSACLSFLGKKTLLVDLDPQGHATLGLGYEPERYEKSLYDVLSPVQDTIPLEEVILRVSAHHHLVPSHVILSAIEQQLSGVYGREEKLMEKLNSVRRRYDFVIIDCPPNLGLLTFNALRASGELVIPVEPSFFSVQGLKKIRETVDLVAETLKHKIRVHALFTLFSERSNFGRTIFEELRQIFGNQLLKTVIHQNIRLREAARAGKSICDFDRKSTGFRDFMLLASELIERGGDPIGSSQPEVTEIREVDEDHSSRGLFELKDKNDSLSFISCEESDEKDFWEKVNQQEVVFKSPVKYAHPFPVPLRDGVVFGYVDANAKLVQIAGDFNNWVNEAMEPSLEEKGIWKKQMNLAPGKYRYKFIVDGEWTVDPQNNISEPNPYGGIDSVIEIAGLMQETLDERSSKT